MPFSQAANLLSHPEEADADEFAQSLNKRNSFNCKNLKTKFGSLPLSVPRNGLASLLHFMSEN